MIYKYVLVSPEYIVPRWRLREVLPPRSTRSGQTVLKAPIDDHLEDLAKCMTGSALPSTCRQIYLESAEIYYSLNTFAFGIDQKQQPCSRFLKAIAETNEEKITSVILFRESPATWTSLTSLPNLTDLVIRFNIDFSRCLWTRVTCLSQIPARILSFCKESKSLKRVRVDYDQASFLFYTQGILKLKACIVGLGIEINDILSRKRLEEQKLLLTNDCKT